MLYQHSCRESLPGLMKVAEADQEHCPLLMESSQKVHSPAIQAFKCADGAANSSKKLLRKQDSIADQFAILHRAARRA